MQRMWIRTLMLLVVALGSMVVVEDASAQGPVRRALRRLFGRGDYVYSDGYATTTTYYRGAGTMQGRTWGGAATYDAEGRLIAPAVDRSARGGVNADADIRLDGRGAPDARIDADANLRARGNVPGAGADARVRGDADVDVNRNNGAIRGNVEGRARGDATTPPAAPKPDAAPDNSTLPPPPPAP